MKSPAFGEHTLVALAASSGESRAEIVYAIGAETEEASVGLRPRDKSSAAALDTDLQRQEHDGPTTADVSPLPANGSSSTQTLYCSSCSYTYAVGTTFACWDPSSNPFGVIQYRVTRSGCNPSRLDQGWCGNYKNNAIICPQPNTAYTWWRCGAP